MPILLTNDDVRPLVESPTEISKGIEATLTSIKLSHASGPGQVVFGDLRMEGPGSNYTKLMGSAGPGQGFGVQIWPSQGNEVTAPESKVMVWFDGSGSLLAIFAADDLNALRTSIPAALGARHLRPEGARRLGILGSGYQAASHARTITAAVPEIEEIKIWSPTQANRERFAREQAARLGVPVEACSSAEEVVSSADILTAAGRTPGGTPAYEGEWVKPGSLLISMTGSAPRDLLQTGARLVVPTTRRPERVAFGFSGTTTPKPAPDPETVVELLDIVEGRVAARESADQPVIWELANVYLWDATIMGWAHDWAVRNAAGQAFELAGDGTIAASP